MRLGMKDEPSIHRIHGRQKGLLSPVGDHHVLTRVPDPKSPEEVWRTGVVWVGFLASLRYQGTAVAQVPLEEVGLSYGEIDPPILHRTADHSLVRIH